MIPGYSHWNWAHPLGTGQNPPAGQEYRVRHFMYPPDLDSPKVFDEGSGIKFSPLRFGGFTGLPAEAMQIDKDTLSTFKRRPKVSNAEDGWFGQFFRIEQTDSYQGAMAVHSTFGFNSVYVGGDYLHGAFQSGNGSPGLAGPGGKFYVDRLSDVFSPSRLIAFGSARANDVTLWGSAWYNADVGSRDGVNGTGGNGRSIRPGYYKVLPPQPVPAGLGDAQRSTAGGMGWDTANGNNEDNTWLATKVPSRFGFLDGRHFGKPVIGHLDGHAEQLSFEQLRDMTRWSNFATERNWTWRRR
jgi:hypothetical protein